MPLMSDWKPQRCVINHLTHWDLLSWCFCPCCIIVLSTWKSDFMPARAAFWFSNEWTKAFLIAQWGTRLCLTSVAVTTRSLFNHRPSSSLASLPYFLSSPVHISPFLSLLAPHRTLSTVSLSFPLLTSLPFFPLTSRFFLHLILVSILPSFIFCLLQYLSYIFFCWSFLCPFHPSSFPPSPPFYLSCQLHLSCALLTYGHAK